MRWLNDSQSSRIRPSTSRGTTTSPSRTQRDADFVAQRVEQFREVPAEVLAAARLQHDVVAVAEHQRAEAVPLRLVGPHSGFVGHLGCGLGQHRVDGRYDG